MLPQISNERDSYEGVLEGVPFLFVLSSFWAGFDVLVGALVEARVRGITVSTKDRFRFPAAIQFTFFSLLVLHLLFDA